MVKAYRIEQEAKFELSPDQQPGEFAEILAQEGYSVASFGTIDLTDIYLDTPSFALLRHGLTVRVRHGLAASEVGIKSLAGARKGPHLARLDLAFPLAAGDDPLDASKWPTALFDELAAVVRVKAKALQPLVVVRQRRAKSHIELTTPDGAAPWLAEWSEDEVWIDTYGRGRDAESQADHSPAANTPPQETAPRAVAPAHFRELEVELLPANRPAATQDEAGESSQVAAERAAFDTFVTFLRARFELIPVYSSKFERGLIYQMTWLHGGARSITPAMPLAGACRLLLHQQLLQILFNEHGVRVGKKARAVHDMRVAIRRARAALRLCTAILPASTRKPLSTGLKQLGDALGTVRDLDVALANLRAFARRQPESSRHSFKRLRAELKAQRTHARSELLHYLESKHHRQFIAALARFCEKPTPKHSPYTSSGGVKRTQVRHTLPSEVWAAFEGVRAYEDVLMQPETSPMETFHALRLATKYLRYLLEFCGHLFGSDGETLDNQLCELQEHLGDLNDAYVEELRWREWDSEVGEDAGLLAAIATRRAELAERMRRLIQTVPLADVIALHSRRRLARALAAI